MWLTTQWKLRRALRRYGRDGDVDAVLGADWSRSREIFAFFREHCPDRQHIYSLCVQIVKTLCVNLYGFVPLAFTGNPLRTVVKGESEA